MPFWSHAKKRVSVAEHKTRFDEAVDMGAAATAAPSINVHFAAGARLRQCNANLNFPEQVPVQNMLAVNCKGRHLGCLLFNLQADRVLMAPMFQKRSDGNAPVAPRTAPTEHPQQARLLATLRFHEMHGYSLPARLARLPKCPPAWGALHRPRKHTALCPASLQTKQTGWAMLILSRTPFKRQTACLGDRFRGRLAKPVVAKTLLSPR